MKIFIIDQRALSGEDLIVWPDHTMCIRSELHEFTHKSDDYRVVPFESDEWTDLMTKEEK